LRLRLSAIFMLLATLTIIDEVIKEGYVFDPADLITPKLTHEKLFVFFLALSLLLGLRRNRRLRAVNNPSFKKK